ncbi:hypothetical protein GCM10011320_09920 [Neoroseomonas lacus]|uniref:Uncharacterized protein n=1 Tax=Neoroseomonas lacus TaxID=287609 RepID=A0A917KB22_9PROT|nr:hypothetical protein GCM10011320_09920 [Neoroseomonas lacus]
MRGIAGPAAPFSVASSRFVVVARANIAMRRLMVASNDPAAPEWRWLMDAIEGLGEHFQEACEAIGPPGPPRCFAASARR